MSWSAEIDAMLVKGCEMSEIFGFLLKTMVNDLGATSGYIEALSGLYSKYVANIHYDNTLDYHIEPIYFDNMRIGKYGLYRPVIDSNILRPYTIKLGILIHYYQLEYEKTELAKTQSMSKAKSLLIANVSHELRTPLNALMGMLALLENTELDNHQWSCMEVIRDASIDLLILINDILDISKLEAGEMQLYPSSTKILDCIESSYKIVGQMAYDKGLKFTFDLDEKVPKHIIVDSNRLKQMLKNLLSNAVKFTKDGSVKTTISIATDAEINKAGLPVVIGLNFDAEMIQRAGMAIKKHNRHNMDKSSGVNVSGAVTPVNTFNSRELGEWNYIKFSIVDTGIGIASENIPKLFKSFSQIDDSSTKEYEGTGLGLAITAQLCLLMKGHISVESTINQGSTFTFIIPVQTHIVKSTQLDLSLLDNRMFLVVDDNPKNLMRITALLEKWGVQFRECENPQRAIISYIDNPKYHFDLGLLDIVMPGMSGNELAAKIASGPNSFPLIALSSATQQLHSVSPAFAGHINKPYSDEELQQMILEVLNRHEISSSSESVSPSNTPTKISPIPSPKLTSVTQPRKTERLISLSKLKFTKKSASQQFDTQPLPTPYHKYQSIKHHEQKDYYAPIKNADIKILVVEDKDRNLQTMVKMLQSAGYKYIDTAINGEAAVEKIHANRGVPFNKRKSQYDVILMDIIMPKMDGITATKKITEMFAARKRPKIIAVTARIIDNAHEEYLKEGMDDVIFKPIVRISSLIEKIANI